MSPLIVEVVGWRREFHAAPELGHREQETSRCVVELLASFGLQAHRGLIGTGVVTTLENGLGPVTGLRTDVDALPITELGSISYHSCRPRMMHACGHSDHTVMPLVVVAHLTQTYQFSGIVHSVFQPAEENLGGAREMVEEGLSERFPMNTIYTLHNWPGIPLSEVAFNDGAVMISLGIFEITLRRKSCHVAMPGSRIDSAVVTAQLITALQTIPSRRLSPQDSMVVSIIQINSDEVIGILPDTVVLRGTLRYLSNRIRTRVRELVESHVATQSQVSDVQDEVNWFPGYPVTKSHILQARQVREMAVATLGAEAVHWNQVPSMASEDLACMSEVCPGVHFRTGTNSETPSKPLHNVSYDFSDVLISLGVAMWVALVEKQLPAM